jgi:uncharacterized protein with PIN domain
MIVVDCSALLAILFDEPEKQAFEDAIGGAQRSLKGPPQSRRLRCLRAGQEHERTLAVKGDDFAETDLQKCL